MDEYNQIQSITNLKEKQLKDIQEFKIKSRLLQIGDFPNFMQNIFRKLGNLPNEQVTPHQLGILASTIVEQEEELSKLGIKGYDLKPAPVSKNPISKFFNSIRNRFVNASIQTTYEMTFEEIEKVANRHEKLFSRVRPNPPINKSYNFDSEAYNRKTNNNFSDISENKKDLLNNSSSISKNNQDLSNNLSIKTLTKNILENNPEVSHEILETPTYGIKTIDKNKSLNSSIQVLNSSDSLEEKD